MRRSAIVHYMGRFPVPRWFFELSPDWLHRAADWCGGVEPSPWRARRRAYEAEGAVMRVRALHRRVPCACTKCAARRSEDLDDDLCGHCTSLSQPGRDGGVRWPCPTITALDQLAKEDR